MFNKVLVANRGEIAVRVMRACRELDIKTVAIYSDVDSDAFHAKYADEAIRLPGTSARDTYLNIEKIIHIAKDTKVDAIHPGYGFLSENSEFAKRCEEEGIIFIGPSAEAIALVGDKIFAKKTAKKVGAPITPGSDGEVENIEVAKKIAKEIGYPVMVKAAGGGGGIGLRVVFNEETLEKEFSGAKSIALSAFGNAAVFIEKYVENPRHIEIQVLADKKGSAVYFPERECTIQRRHQKLIEESPSPVITEDLRKKLGEIAVNIIKSVNYTNAATVEFIYSNGKYYFMEINSRIQVEHPVTEVVTGFDLVKEQIRIASGLPLSITQDDIKINCCAIECRINAEDPLNNFLPSPGKILGYRSPGGVGIRIDSGIHHSYTIPSAYDSLISKLIAFGKDRKEAIERMKRALYEYIIVGVKTNIPFHKAVMNNPVFLSGNFSTRFLEEQPHLNQEIERIIAEEKTLEKKLQSIFKDVEIKKDDKKTIPAIVAATAIFLSKTEKHKEETQPAVHCQMPQSTSFWKITGRVDIQNVRKIR